MLRDRPVFVAVSSGGRFSGERARQPDFLTPYLKAILGTIGLHDLTFFSVQGTVSGPDAVAEARTKTDQALQEYFSSFCPGTLVAASSAKTAGFGVPFLYRSGAPEEIRTLDPGFVV